MTQQVRVWGFTLNNYTPEEVAAIKAVNMEGILYMCFQTEVAPETGTPHLQGMWQFPGRGRRFNGVKSLPGMQRANLQPKRCGAWVNRVYCTKLESRAVVNYEFFEAGETPEPQGTRNDIAEVRDVVYRTGSMKKVLDVATSFQAIKVAETCLKYAPCPERPDIRVRWFWGPTGSGKTREARQQAGPDRWMSSRNLKWWDGYDGERNIVIDDYRRDFCTFHELLRILDRYEYRIEVKGGMRPLHATNIWITAPLPPAEMWAGRTDEELGQLLRRIHEIRHFPALAEQKAQEPENADGAHNLRGDPQSEPEVGGNTVAPTSPARGITPEDLPTNVTVVAVPEPEAPPQAVPRAARNRTKERKAKKAKGIMASAEAEITRACIVQHMTVWTEVMDELKYEYMCAVGRDC